MGMVVLRVEPSESFEQSAEIEVAVEGVETVEALLGVVGEKLLAKVTELFAWDNDFGEFALVEKLSDVTERAQVTVEAVAVTPDDPARAKRAAKLGLPADATDADIAEAKANKKRAKIAIALGLPEDASEEDIQKAKFAGSLASPPAAPSGLSELPPAVEAPKPTSTPSPPTSPQAQLDPNSLTDAGPAEAVQEEHIAAVDGHTKQDKPKQAKVSSKPALRTGEMKVGARSTKEVDVTLRPGERLCWAFHVKDKDVVLSVRVDDKDQDSVGDGWTEQGLVVPAAKLLSTDGHLVGEYSFDPGQVEDEGEGAAAADSRMERLTFIWDNHYSKLTAKTVAFRMQICRAGTLTGADILDSEGQAVITTDEFAARSSDDGMRRDQARLSFRSSLTSGPTAASGSGSVARGSSGSDAGAATGAVTPSAASPRMGRRASILQRASSAKALATAAIADLGGAEVIAWNAPPDLAKQGALNAQWRSDILPHWSRDKDTKSCRALIGAGVPPEIRPIMWRCVLSSFPLGSINQALYIASIMCAVVCCAVLCGEQCGSRQPAWCDTLTVSSCCCECATNCSSSGK